MLPVKGGRHMNISFDHFTTNKHTIPGARMQLVVKVCYKKVQKIPPEHEKPHQSILC